MDPRDTLDPRDPMDPRLVEPRHIFRPQSALSYQVNLAGRLLRRCLQAAHDRYGLYPGRDLALMEIRRRDERVSPKQLCETLDMSRNSLSTVLRRAASDGYVIRLPDGRDGRSVRLSLTGTGRVCAELMAEAWNDIDTLLLASLGEEGFRDLGRLLTRTSAHLRARAASERSYYFPATR